MLRNVREPDTLASFMNLQATAGELLLSCIDVRVLVAQEANEGLLLQRLGELSNLVDDLAALVELRLQELVVQNSAL